ncbi:TetR/AcrR family transcriptional regulator [Thalassobaculum sp.]|uniref:TetR/AcrR family transcriptional regulator n=1 Tax=Thalassobaculum sp. TaxID=2022740 RepID=UPI0032EF678F
MPRRPDTRQRIERAALSLFAAKGVDATTTKDIAAEVDISEAAIYRHFRSKDELTWHLFSTHYVELAGHIDRVTTDTPALTDRIERVVALFCDLFDREPALFTFILLTQHGQLGRVTEDMPTPVESLRRMFQAGVDGGECRGSDPDLLTAMALGLVTQPATFAIYGRIPRPLGRLAPELTEAVKRAVLR